MSSVAMRLLFQLDRANKGAGRTCVVVATPNSVMGEILKVMRADTVLRCASTVEEARAMLS
jgi:anti-anti-sigma regulatory factor